MARRSDGSVNGGLESSTGASTVNDNYTLAIWIDMETITAEDCYMIVNSNLAARGYGLVYRSTNVVQGIHAGINFFGGGAFSTTGWTHWVLRRLSGVSQIYRNGATFGATWATTPNACLSTDPFICPYQSPIQAKFAEASMWERGLDVNEIAALAKGCSALLMPRSLKFHVPMLGRAAPEPELKSGITMNTSGTFAAVEHPRIIMPRASMKQYQPHAPYFKAGWAGGSNLPVLGTGTY